MSHGRRALPGVALACLAALMSVAAPAAAQSTGGASPTAPRAQPRLGPPPPGVVARPAPELISWSCMSACASTISARTGSVLRIRGRALTRAYEVIFLGAEGTEDDVTAAPLNKRRTRVDVRVPLGAAPGPIVVADRDGQQSEEGAAIAIEWSTGSESHAAAVEVQVQSRRAFFDAERPAKVSYVVHGDSPATVRVELLRTRDGGVVASWDVAGVPPEQPQSLTWDGTAGGKVQRDGRYTFRVSAQNAAGVRAVSAQLPPEPAEPNPAEFVFLRHEFPVRGPHGYGESAARFGGGRGHQGQDVFAACGTPLVAARGGEVKFKQYHAAAGNYIVIDGKQTSVDYAYMHMRDAALVDEGDRVRTGQLIGYVGATGRASGCHLHLEMWSAPGWYDGGSPFDPLPSLMAWDKRS